MTDAGRRSVVRSARNPAPLSEWVIKIYGNFIAILYDRVGTGKLCIEVTPVDKIATISETLCIGCGICVKVSLLNLVEQLIFLCDIEMSL